MSRKIVAIDAAAKDGSLYLVLCDDGTVWSWAHPNARRRLNREAWEELGPDLPQDS